MSSKYKIDISNSGVTSYCDISSLILGDDLIDWEKLRKDNNNLSKLQLQKWW